jgi:hypothetical protein
MDNHGFFENKILQGITSEYEVNYVNIGRCVNPNEDDLIRTITVNTNGKKTPVFLIHGFLLALGLWIHDILFLLDTAWVVFLFRLTPYSIPNELRT